MSKGPLTTHHSPATSVGARCLRDNTCRFRVWAPLAKKVEMHLVAPVDRLVPLTAGPDGYHEAIIEDVPPGSRYLYRLDGYRERPDPASKSQPDGVHGPSEVIDTHFDSEDQAWHGLPLQDYILYELHVGTFTPEGTFDAVIPWLDELKELGVTAIELMPVAQFPGARNWGYDGVYLFAAQNTYGGPQGLKRLVNACHRRGLAVVLDVVYNHIGPEGNYLGEFGPYFTDFYRTAWGPALNFDRAHSDEVRRFFIDNALHWMIDFHIDALRLDAVHAIHDNSATPFLQELAVATEREAERRNRRFYLIAESDLNDARLILRREQGGYGLHAQWSDDLHHSLHTLLTGEHAGYYKDFGKLDHLVRAYRDGYTYSGQYSPYRKRRFGNSSRLNVGHQFVVCTCNHDQIGNRMLGDRPSESLSLDSLKLAAATVLLSPYLPLLFMGEEYGETAPFQYFISHGDPALVEAVCKGRHKEFAAFAWQGAVPDPAAEATFVRCKIRRELRHQGQHRVLWDFYKELVRLRKTLPALTLLSKEHQEVRGYEEQKCLFVRRWARREEAFMVSNYSDAEAPLSLPVPAGTWRKELDSADAKWQGRGSRLADQLTVNGSVTLSIGPRALVLYSQCAPG